MMRQILTTLLSILVVFNCTAQLKSLPYDHYIQMRAGIERANQRIELDKKATIAFLGGSITFNEGWRNMVCEYLRTQYPQTQFTFIAAGIPSLGSLPHSFRLQQDVLDSGKVDLLFLEAAVNDQVNGTDSLTQMRALEGIVRHAIRSNPKMDIIMMSFADPDKTRSYNEGHVPLSVANHERIASYYGLPSINLAKAVRDKLQNKEFDWDRDFVDLHPSSFGQKLYFEAIKTLLSLSKQSMELKLRIGRLPKALDENSFSTGTYYNINNAKVDAGWKLVKSWQPSDGLGTRAKFVDVPVLESAKKGARLSLKFKGNAVGMAIVSGGDAGIVRYQIDNGPEQQLDLFTAWSDSLHLPWYVIFDSGLKEGHHTLTLTISDDKNPKSKGHACRIVNFLLNR